MTSINSTYFSMQVQPKSVSSSSVQNSYEAKSDSAKKVFLDYMNLTAEERLFDAFLKKNGMTQEEFDAMPLDQRQEILEDFEEYMITEMENSAANRVSGVVDLA